MFRLGLLSLLCGALIAQVNPPPTQPGNEQTPADQVPLFRGKVELVVAPVLVFDRNGDYVNGIRPDQFRLFDNDKEQNINVDVAYTPISLVICIQSNANVQALLPEVNKIGNLVQPLVIGEQGEAAIIAYDSRVRVLQEFTSDADKITQAIKKIAPGSYSNRMIDAVDAGTRMLSNRPRNRRRIIMVVGETRDVGSETRARVALMNLQLANVMLYGVDMSRFINTLTAPPKPGRPDNLPPAMHPMPTNVPSTPTTVAQTYGLNGGRAEFIPLMIELFRDAKAIFKDNPIELFTKGTGGSEFGFHSNRTLEEAMQKVGEELHSEYTISYSPSNGGEGGFHTISVDVVGRTDARRVQTRPGYWVAAAPATR